MLKKCVVLFGCILIQLTLGSRYSLINFSPYIISYLRKRTDDVSVRNVDILWVITAGIVGRSVGMTLGGLLDRRFGTRVAVSAGSFVFVTSIVLCNWAVKDSFLAFVFAYGGYGSFGMMMCYGVTIQTAIKWMNKRPALASGVVMMGLGASAFIFNQVITQYINPDNLTPNRTETEKNERYFLDDDLLDRVPTCFLLLGGIFAGMMFIGVLCLFPAPTGDKDITKNKAPTQNGETVKEIAVSVVHQTETYSEDKPNLTDEKPRITEETPELTVEKQIPTHDSNETTLTVKEAIKMAFKSRSFYILWFTMFFVDSGVQFPIAMNKAYGQTFIEDDHFLALVGSVGSIFNCIMRPVWGLFADRFGFKVSMRLMTVSMAATVGTLFLTEHLHKAFYMVWTACLYAAFCGTVTVVPATLSKLFGPQNMAVNYGFIMTAVGCGTVLSSLTGTMLKEILGWHNMFFYSAGLTIIPFFLTFIFNGTDKDGTRI